MIIYTTPTCSRCHQLMVALRRWGIQYEAIDVSTAEGLTEMRLNGAFGSELPILQSDNGAWTPQTMFRGNILDEKAVREICQAGQAQPTTHQSR